MCSGRCIVSKVTPVERLNKESSDKGKEFYRSYFIFTVNQAENIF